MSSIQSNINRAVAGELARIVLFVFYYIFNILLGFGLFIGAFFISKYSLHILNFWIIVANIGIWIMAAMVGFYLIKPLFKFTKNRNPKRVEVTEKECPKLFEMIRSVATATKCKMPKHVYLSPDVNACVFYNTSFWSIFFPVRKNLEIGLGLFDGLNVSEIEAIIGHEFGHFAQGSMKVGSVVYVVNTILYNLVCTDDSWDDTVNGMILSDITSFRIAGGLTHWVTGIISNNTAHVYRFVQKGYLKLSRYMEFDADSVSCRAIGSDAFISAIAKLDIASYEEEQYEGIASSLLAHNETVAHYFDSKKVTDQAIPRYGMPIIDNNIVLADLHKSRKIPSKVQVENIWSSHPSTIDRISEARKLNVEKHIDKTNAWSLIPTETRDRVSEHLLKLIAEGRESLTSISETDFKVFVKDFVKKGYMRGDLAPFFNRDILLFDVDKIDLSTPVHSPFNESNALLIEQYNTLVGDYRILVAFRDKQIEAKEIMYDGVVYKRNNLPLDKMNEEYKPLAAKVEGIDKSVFAFLFQNSTTEVQQRIPELYKSLCYAAYMNREVLPEVKQYRDAFVAELNRITRRDESEFKGLLEAVKDFGGYVKKLTKALDYERLEVFVTADGLEGWKKFARVKHDFYYESTGRIEVKALNELVLHVDSILAAFNDCSSYINAQLESIAETIVPE